METIRTAKTKVTLKDGEVSDESLSQDYMSRNRRTHILVNGDPALSKSICASIEADCDVSIVNDPREVLVMNKVRETAQNSLFYLGEALLTECKVTVNGTIGIGMILGSRHERAYELAVIDAAFSLSEHHAKYHIWLHELMTEEKRLAELQAQKRAKLESTRVEFASMLAAED